MNAPPNPALVLPTGSTDVAYYLGDGVLAAVAAIVGRHAAGGRAYIVTDATVAPLHGERVASSLDGALLAVPAGEASKRWETVERIARWLIGCGVERRDVVVAVGGGVVTDVGGFAASIVLRGLPWVAVPTTLLGMVDAAVGGKTGIDLDLGKNLLGTFWPARAVVADPLVLATLDARELRAGLAEIVKMGMIAPATVSIVIEQHLAAIAAGRLEHAAGLIHAAVRAKGEVVAADALDAGARAALNLGHTLGHALEAAGEYRRFLHGEAVAWGLLAELRIARERGLVSDETCRVWARRIEMLAPLPTLAGLTWAVLAPFVARDKKRSGGNVGWVLPRDGGAVLGVAVRDDEAARAFGWLSSLSPTGPFATAF